MLAILCGRLLLACWLGHSGPCLIFFILIHLPSHARLDTSHHTPRTRHSPAEELELHVSTHAPNSRPTIPHTPRNYSMCFFIYKLEAQMMIMVGFLQLQGRKQRLNM
ncbi:hypothetical protein Hanom_Chr16g01425201 [Helianthus anomalus]